MTWSKEFEKSLMDCLRLVERERDCTLKAMVVLRHLLQTARDEESRETSRKLLREWQSDVRLCEIAMGVLTEILERVRGYWPAPAECLQLPENLQQIKDHAKKAKS